MFQGAITTGANWAAISQQLLEALTCKIQGIVDRFAASSSVVPLPQAWTAAGSDPAQASEAQAAGPGSSTQNDVLQANDSPLITPLSQLSVPSSMGLTAMENSHNQISAGPVMEPQLVNVAQAQPTWVASVQPAPAAVLQAALVAETQQAKDQQLGSSQKEANGGLGPGGQAGGPAHLQQAGSQEMGPPCLSVGVGKNIDLFQHVCVFIFWAQS